MAGIASTANRESRIRSADGQQAQGMLMPSVLQSASNLTACERQVAPWHGPSKAQIHCDCRYPAESTRVGGHGTPPHTARTHRSTGWSSGGARLKPPSGLSTPCTVSLFRDRILSRTAAVVKPLYRGNRIVSWRCQGLAMRKSIKICNYDVSRAHKQVIWRQSRFWGEMWVERKEGLALRLFARIWGIRGEVCLRCDSNRASAGTRKGLSLTPRLLELKGITEQGGSTQRRLRAGWRGDLNSVSLYGDAGGQCLLWFPRFRRASGADMWFFHQVSHWELRDQIQGTEWLFLSGNEHSFCSLTQITFQVPPPIVLPQILWGCTASAPGGSGGPSWAPLKDGPQQQGPPTQRLHLRSPLRRVASPHQMPPYRRREWKRFRGPHDSGPYMKNRTGWTPVSLKTGDWCTRTATGVDSISSPR